MLLFLHIPKTGGTSLAKILTMQYTDDEILWLNPSSTNKDKDKINKYGLNVLGDLSFKKLSKTDKNIIKRFSCSPNSKLICGHFSYGIHKYSKKKARYITFVRNPETLIPSLFKEMFISDDNFDVTLVKMFKNPEEFASKIYNVQTFILSGFQCYQEMIENEEKALSAAIRNINENFFYIGLLEHMQESIKKLTEILNWKEIYNIPHLKKGNYNHHEFSQEFKEIVIKKNFMDKQLYTYIANKYRF